jgi:hypothetical protein
MDRMPLAGRKERLLFRFDDSDFLEGGIGVVVGGVERFVAFECGYILVRTGGTAVLVFC